MEKNSYWIKKLLIFSFSAASSLTRSKPHVEAISRTMLTQSFVIFVLLILGLLPWQMNFAPRLYAAESRAALRAYQEVTEIRFSEAQAMLRKKKWSEAAAILRSILRDQPTFLPAAIGLSKALVQLGFREDGLVLLMNTLKSQNKKARLQLERRIKVLSRIFLTNETFQVYQEGLSLFLVSKYNESKKKFVLALEREPDNVEIIVRLGQAHVLAGEYDSAVEQLTIAKRLNPFEPEVRLWLGRALHLYGKPKKGIQELEVVSRTYKKSEQLPVWLADAYQSVGDTTKALKILTDDVKRTPFHLQSLLKAAQIKFENRPKEKEANQRRLWDVKKDLQVALSRFDDYLNSEEDFVEGDLGRVRKHPEQVKEKLQGLLNEVEANLAKQT